jgi:hypothetical protein
MIDGHPAIRLNRGGVLKELRIIEWAYTNKNMSVSMDCLYRALHCVFSRKAFVYFACRNEKERYFLWMVSFKIESEQ